MLLIPWKWHSILLFLLKKESPITYEDIKPLLDSIALEDFIVKDAKIKAYSSVEGDQKINENLQQKRAESIIKAMESVQESAIPSIIEAKEDWELMHAQIQRDSIHLDWLDKTPHEIKELPQTKIRKETTLFSPTKKSKSKFQNKIPIQ